MKKLTLLFVLAFIIQGLGYSQPCLPDGIHFTSQAQIDNFQINNPNCTEIEGDVEISGNNITNLNGLSVLTAIGGDFSIGFNAALTSLTGLENVTFFGAVVNIFSNASLTSLIGLDNVTSIGGVLIIYGNNALTSLTELENVTFIGGCSISNNAALTSLTGLENVTFFGGNLVIIGNAALTSLIGLDNVTSIGGHVYVTSNAALTSLTGLDNIDAGSITHLYISDNNLLSTCEVQSVCDYLANPIGTIEIHDNTTGCNNQQEVEAACEAATVDEINLADNISIYPNPTTDKLFITSNNGLKIETVNIYNQLGQIVLKRNEIKENINISSLGQGIYIIELTSSELKIRQKLIIEE